MGATPPMIWEGRNNPPAPVSSANAYANVRNTGGSSHSVGTASWLWIQPRRQLLLQRRKEQDLQECFKAGVRLLGGCVLTTMRKRLMLVAIRLKPSTRASNPTASPTARTFPSIGLFDCMRAQLQKKIKNRKEIKITFDLKCRNACNCTDIIFTFGRLFLLVLLFGSANCFFFWVTFNVAPYSNNGTPPTPSTSSASALCNRRCRRRCQGCHHLPTLLPKSHQQSPQYSDPPLK